MHKFSNFKTKRRRNIFKSEVKIKRNSKNMRKVEGRSTNKIVNN